MAPQLIIESTDMLITLKTTYDEAFGKYSSGHQLLHDVIQHLFAHQPGKVIEFYTDATTDQLV